MALYISLDDAIRPYQNSFKSDFAQCSCIVDMLKSLPTIEIVSCKDCMYRHTFNGEMICIRHTGQVIEEDYFCNFGKETRR